MSDTAANHPISIKRDRVAIGRYKGWFRGQVQGQTYLTPLPGDQFEFKCDAQDVFDAWVRGIQANAVALHRMSLPAPQGRPDDRPLVVALFTSPDGRVAPAFGEPGTQFALAGHALIGVSSQVHPNVASLAYGAWAAAWLSPEEMQRLTGPDVAMAFIEDGADLQLDSNQVPKRNPLANHH